ncbi:MAG: S-layer homology domain-containing protein [bacterium JZ-2024 1]
MKGWFCGWVLLGILAGQAAAGAGRGPADIPPNHWAYQTIQQLLARGWMTLYDDGTFRGDRPVDRLTFAATLGKILDDLSRGVPGGVSRKDLDDLKALAEEFKDDIVNFKVKSEELERRIVQLDESQQAIQQDVTRVADELDERITMLDEARKADKIELLTQIEELNRQIERLNLKLQKEMEANRKAHSTLWVGVLVALALGVAVS